MRYLLVLALVILSVAPVAAQSQAVDRPPNVLMIVGDDMAWTDYDFLGHPHVKTPNIAKLAQGGALFPQGYVPTSLCRASLATLLTGRYAHEHKICCNDPPMGIDRAEMLPFLKATPTIPRWLGEKGGYLSFQTGKFWEGHFANGGFTDGMTTKGRHGEEGLVIGRQTLQPIYDFIDKASEKEKPWFVWYAPMMPHTPHNPPAKYLERYTKAGLNERVAKYYAMCEWFDDTCGQLVDHLEKKKLRDNTLIVYVVDNGWIQSTAMPPAAGEQFLTRSKNTPYDGGVRTPIILNWPGKIAPAKFNEPVSTIDLLPSIVSACRMSPPAGLHGLDLFAVATGKAKLERPRIFGEIYQHNCVELGKPALSLTHRWVREGRWKLIVPAAEGKRSELYDLDADPQEKTDHAGKEAERVTALRKALDTWWSAR